MDKLLFAIKRDDCQTCICKTCEYQYNKQCGNCYKCKNYENHWTICSLHISKLHKKILDESSLSSVEKGNMMKNIAVTKQFIEYSKTLAEDIYGYNQCFNRGNSKN